MNPEQRRVLEMEYERIRAREDIRFIAAVTSAFSKEGGEHLRALGEVAFHNDDYARAVFLEALTRRTV